MLLHTLHGRSLPASWPNSLLSYSDPYMYATTEVNFVVRSGSRGRQTNSAAAPVWSYQEPPANPEKLRIDNASKFGPNSK